MERKKLAIILKMYVKDLEKEYLLSKHKNKPFIGLLSKKFKDTQKVLEYLRKDYPYDYKYEEYNQYGICFHEHHLISVFGRDTWRKINRDFVAEINKNEFNKYEKIYNNTYLRKLKIKRILN